MTFEVILRRDDGTIVLVKHGNAAHELIWEAGLGQTVVNDHGDYQLAGFSLVPKVIEVPLPSALRHG